MTGATKHPKPVEATSMRATDPEVTDAAWESVSQFIPRHVDNHPKGGHRPRIDDRTCFEVIHVRLVTGCSWVDAEAFCGWKVSDTTVRDRYNLWVDAGVFKKVAANAVIAYDRIIGLDLSEIAIDGSLHKAPCGGEGTGPSPIDRGKLGHKWSLGTDAVGIPIAWAFDGANRHDIPLLEPTLVSLRNLDLDVGRLHLDKGYDASTVRALLDTFGLADVVIDKRRKPGEPKPKRQVAKDGSHTMGLRWPVERTNSWLSNFGQLRRSTDRRAGHREGQFCLAVLFIIVSKLIDHRDRWCR